MKLHALHIDAARFGFPAWLFVLLLNLPGLRAEMIFQDDFKGRPGEGWSWVREHREAWRASTNGLEVRIEPGNMWGPQNDAKNVLVRLAPEITNHEVEVNVTFKNNPEHQYEQCDLVWYLDDSNMVKLGQELVDGKLSVVMGREENDKTKTVKIVPIQFAELELRLLVNSSGVRGAFRKAGDPGWREVGECALPVSPGKRPRISLQFYQGEEKLENWARATGFRVFSKPL